MKIRTPKNSRDSVFGYISLHNIVLKRHPIGSYILYLINSIVDVPLNNYPIMDSFHMLADHPPHLQISQGFFPTVCSLHFNSTSTSEKNTFHNKSSLPDRQRHTTLAQRHSINPKSALQ